MDVRCPKCGEPWDLDSIHERAAELLANGVPACDGATFEKVSADFRRRGCVALGDACPTPEEVGATEWDLTPAQAAATLYELLGDDMDGAASMLEDLGF